MLAALAGRNYDRPPQQSAATLGGRPGIQSAMMKDVAPFLVILFVAAVCIYTGVQGLRGHDITVVENRAGRLKSVSGRDARWFGVVYLTVGAGTLIFCGWAMWRVFRAT